MGVRKSESEKLEAMAYLQEHSVKDTARAFGVSEGTIRFWDALYHGKNRKLMRHKINESDLRTFLSENEEATVKDIAGYFHCSVQSVYLKLEQLGIKLSVLRKKRLSKKISSTHGSDERKHSGKTAEISSYIIENQDKTLQEIGDAFGVSKQYIHHLIVLKGLRYEPKSTRIKDERKRKSAVKKLVRLAKQYPSLSYKALSEKVNLSKKFISKELRERGFKKRHFYKIDDSECKKLLLKDMTYQQVADRLHVSRISVARAAKRLNLQKRK